jgi:sterol desaturase/sphingolipid hydroxylase (fatty acid hydroxylase superfamily)
LNSVVVSALVMTVIVGVRYVVTSGLFAALTARVRPGHYTGLGPQMRREIGWSLASAAVYGVPAGVVAWGWQQHGWTLIYTDPAAYPLWWMPVSLLLFLLAHDTWFYWTHRWMHRPAVFATFHAVHHASRPPTAWAAMSFHPYEAITGAVVIPVLAFVIPIHIGMLGLVLTIMTVMGVTNHMGWEMFPRWVVHSRLGNWLITASHHSRHHEQYRCNYGLYFRIWDRLCGTDKGLSNP